MSDLSFDVVVVGAGPAGSSAARQARSEGLSVAVIDRAVFPRHKLCGALVSPRAHKAVKAVFGLELAPEQYLASRKVAFKWSGETLNEFEAPYAMTYAYRMDFDHWLLKDAIAAGARDFQGCRIATLDEAAGRLTLEGGEAIAFKVLIGADGAASPIAKHILGAAYDPEKIGFTYEIEAPCGCEAEALMSIDFDIVRWGYGWNFPKRDTRTIGLGAIRSVDQDLRVLMDRYLAQEGVDPASVKVKGAHIPLGDYKPRPGKGNVLLAGDAAGFVDALTGEGIALALESGAEAAKAAAQVIGEGRPHRADRAYVARVKYIQDDLDRVKKLRVIACSSAMRDIFKDKLANSNLMRSSFFEVLAGDITYAEIEKRAAKKAVTGMMRKLSAWPSKLAGRAG